MESRSKTEVGEKNEQKKKKTIGITIVFRLLLRDTGQPLLSRTPNKCFFFFPIMFLFPCVILRANIIVIMTVACLRHGYRCPTSLSREFDFGLSSKSATGARLPRTEPQWRLLTELRRDDGTRFNFPPLPLPCPGVCHELQRRELTKKKKNHLSLPRLSIRAYNTLTTKSID